MITDSAPNFLNRITSLLEKASIDLKHWEIDHICYRTDSQESYLDTLSEFSKLGTLLIESVVGGRPIATFKLTKPIEYKNYLIDLVEVPAPKKGRKVQRGFEHIELVIDCSFAELMQLNPGVAFETKGLQKDLNPELEIDFGECAVKFHHKSLEHIINIEKNDHIMSFLRKTQILKEFKDFNPLLSGSFPLAIDVDHSDLDILLCSSNLSECCSKLEDKFSSYPNFLKKKKIFQNYEVCIFSFQFEGLKIELFCSTQSVYSQQANTHLLVEGRILKVMDQSFKKKVRELKQSGMKTEPAFGKLLSLNNPYLDLIKLSKLNDLELKQTFLK